MNNIDIKDDIYIRPKYLSEYIGQEKIKDSLNIFIKAALKREEVLDHVLLYGPTGVGKTTLAHIISNELNQNIKSIAAPSIEKPIELLSILSSLNEGDILFIDEIHRLQKNIEEILYQAIEDYSVDIIINKDTNPKNIKIDLPPFTLIGATTKYGDISKPLRDRFGVIFELDYYTNLEIENIILRTAKVFDTKIDINAVKDIAKRSRNIPRIANRLFRRIRDFAYVLNDNFISYDLAYESLNKLGINEIGLDNSDLKYLNFIVNDCNLTPVGIDTLSISLGYDKNTIIDVIEPYLIKEGFIKRTSNGRVATTKAKEYLRGINDVKN